MWPLGEQAVTGSAVSFDCPVNPWWPQMRKLVLEERASATERKSRLLFARFRWGAARVGRVFISLPTGPRATCPQGGEGS